MMRTEVAEMEGHGLGPPGADRVRKEPPLGLWREKALPHLDGGSGLQVHEDKFLSSKAPSLCSFVKEAKGN